MQAQLLLGLPATALQLVLDLLDSSTKCALLCTCKCARTAVLNHSPQLTFKLDGSRPDAASGDALCALLASRTEALDLTLSLRGV